VWDKETNSPLHNVYELSFLSQLPSLGFKTFNLIHITEQEAADSQSVITHYNKHNMTKVRHVSIENKFLRASISLDDDFNVQLSTKHSVSLNQTRDINVEFLTYSSRRSGAYIFAPTGPASDEHFQSLPSVTLITGRVLSRLIISHETVTQVIQLIDDVSGDLGVKFDIENVVDMSSLNEKELVMRLNTGVKNKQVFYSDQNGYHSVKRKILPNFPLEANFYPSTSVTYVQDNRGRVSLILGQPMGVSSQREGGLEVMLDRRLQYDDGRGMGEGIMDNRLVVSRVCVVS